MLIHKQYKLILSYDGEGSYAGSKRERHTTPPELYNLAKDPYEQNNLYGTLPTVSESLRTKLENWYPLEKRAVIEEPGQ